jgi:FkbM family methyltransferase
MRFLESAESWALARTRRSIASGIRRHPELGLEKLGTAYGGWVVPTRLIEPGWRCYSGGVGEDVSFDLGLIERFGCDVTAFDPTPRAITFAEAVAEREPRFRFVPVGLWSEDTTLRFYRPKDPAHVSHSIVNLQKTHPAFEAPVRRIDSLMAELGHTSVDLVKIDIEGAEHKVLASMLKAGIRPTVLCFEVDRPVSAFRLWRTIRRVKHHDYELAAVDGWNFTFVRRGAMARVWGRPPATTAHEPKITFGIIVLNGEPFTRYLLRSLYPFAHEIIAVEGAAPGAHNIASPDGHSRDGTLAELRRFKAEEDPDGKITVVTAEDEGHPAGWWPGEKHEQSRAYAKRATGNYLWQVDVDEFYRAEEMSRVIDMLRGDPTIDAVTFKQITFWGGLHYKVDGWYLRRGATYYHRLFKWGPGYEYATHRPPTVFDADRRELRTGNWLRGEDLAEQGINLYHYSLLLPKQVIEKCDYYGNAAWARRPGAIVWAREAFLRLGRPYRVHNVYDFPSWLERYDGPHPAEIVRLVDDLARSRPNELRPTADIERLLGTWWYGLGRRGLIAVDDVLIIRLRLTHSTRRRVKRLVRRAKGVVPPTIAKLIRRTALLRSRL